MADILNIPFRRRQGDTLLTALPRFRDPDDSAAPARPRTIYGYVFPGIFVGTLVTIFSGAIKTPHR